MTRRLATAISGTAIVLVFARSLVTQSRPADSARLTAIYFEASETARTLPTTDSLRRPLLLRIAHAQISADDLNGALRTASSLGFWRQEVQTDAMCRLLEDRRFDDAHDVVRRLPDGDRDWALAHLASQLARPPWSLRRRAPDTVDTAALARRALAIAAEPRLAEPRVDAYISIANSPLRRQDTVNANRAFDLALAQLARVRDSNFVSSRRFLIASGLGRTGRSAAALDLAGALPAWDRLDLAPEISRWPNVNRPRARAMLASLVPLLDSIRDPITRAERIGRLADAFGWLGDSALATSLDARRRYFDPATGRVWKWNDVPPSVVDRAVAIVNSDLGKAMAMVDSLDDPLRVGRRARAYTALATAIPYTQRDTIADLLRRAQQEALRASLTRNSRNHVLSSIAGEQIGRGFFDDAVGTIDAIADSVTAASAMIDLGATTFAPLSPRDRRKFVARLANASVRNNATARIVEQTLDAIPRANADVAYANALADSIPAGPARQAAFVALARNVVARGDTASGRAKLIALLATHRVERRVGRYFNDDALIPALVMSGAVDEVTTWARGRADAFERASALLSIGSAIQIRARIGQPIWISNGPDTCREEF